MTVLQPYELWGRYPEVDGTLALRAQGHLDEMESTKQLVHILQGLWKPGMTVLDAGCNAGHYLRGIRRISSQLDYTGIDPFDHYISQAREIFKHDDLATFDIDSIMTPLAKDAFDIVFCCNVLLHLPYSRKPLGHLIDATRQYCVVRTLLDDNTTLVKSIRSEQDIDDNDEATAFYYLNTYSTDDVVTFIRQQGCDAEVIDDKFDASVLESECSTLKGGSGTRIVDGLQVNGHIIYNWKFIKITKP